MDRALRPSRFDILPNTTVSAKEFKHLFRTFESYLSVLPQENLNKLNVLINFISSEIFEYVSDSTTFSN